MPTPRGWFTTSVVDGKIFAIGAAQPPSGPWLATVDIAIGVGDVGVAGPLPGTALPNPNPPSSPIFSSLLAMHFSAHVEKFTQGHTLTLANQHALASGHKVTLSNGAGDRVAIELIADFPDFIPNPLPALPANVRLSNPFHVVVVDDQAYVTDGGQNHLWQVDIPSGTVSVLAAFPSIPNPFFNPAPPPPSLGGPVIEAVPTGIRHVNGQLLVTLFSGVPFAPGFSQVQTIDPLTGDQAPLITGLKTAVDVIPIQDGDGVGYLVLQHASTGFFFGSPGSLLGFGAPSDPPVIIADCLTRPTSMTLDEKTGILYVTEYAGRVVAIPLTM